MGSGPSGWIAGVLLFSSAEMVFRRLENGRLSCTPPAVPLCPDMVGYPETEPLGLAMGCLGFILIWKKHKSTAACLPALRTGRADGRIKHPCRGIFCFPASGHLVGLAFPRRQHFPGAPPQPVG